MAMKAGVPGSLRRRVFREGDYCCAECGLRGREERFPGGGYGYPTALPGVYLSIDHVTPRAKGGSSARENLRVLCTVCNTRKGAKIDTARIVADQLAEPPSELLASPFEGAHSASLIVHEQRHARAAS